MQIIVARKDDYLDEMRKHAGTNVLIVPYGLDWTPVIKAKDTLEALLTLPLRRLPDYSIGEIVTKAVQ